MAASISTIMSGTTANTDALDCGALFVQTARGDCVRPAAASRRTRRLSGASAPTTTSGSTPRVTSARTVSVGTRSRRQTSGNSWSSTKVANCRSGTIRPLGVGTCSELRRLERNALVVGGARHDVDEIDVVAQLRDRRPGDRSVERRGQAPRADAEPARLVLVDADPDLPGRLHPVEMNVTRPRVGAKHVGELERDPANLVLVRARDPILQRPADRRAQFERDSRLRRRRETARPAPPRVSAARVRAPRGLFVTMTNCAKNGLASCTSSVRMNRIAPRPTYVLKWSTSGSPCSTASKRFACASVA